MPELTSRDSGIEFVIKKGNNYMSLTSGPLKFLDIVNYLAAGTSYAKFLKAYGVEDGKGFFPYEWFDNLNKLEEPRLPPHTAFYSRLRNNNITEAEYQQCQMVWRGERCRTMRDYLVWYNNQDVGPFLQAVQGMVDHFWRQYQIDIFKGPVSLPGVASLLMHQKAEQQGATFALFGRKQESLHDLVRTNLVGGPSIIFHR